MNTMQPQWHSTDDDEQPVRISARPVAQVKKSEMPRGNRSPGAIVGVLIVLGIGFSLFQGVSFLQGQVTPEPDAEIQITQSGVDPEEITVNPGDVIRWTNAASIPHILESDTLPPEDPEDDEETFTTGAIFPQATFTYTIPSDAQPGTYEYISATSATIAGTIIIEMPTQGGTSSVTTSTAASQAQSVATSIAPASSVMSSVVTASSAGFSAGGTIQDGVIPENPNTVGGGTIKPPTGQVTTRSSAASRPPISQHTPTSQAQTGVEAWMTVIIAVIALAGVAYRAKNA